MKEQLISFETAKLAKEKGFNEPVFWYYEQKSKDIYSLNEFPIESYDGNLKEEDLFINYNDWEEAIKESEQFKNNSLFLSENPDSYWEKKKNIFDWTRNMTAIEYKKCIMDNMIKGYEESLLQRNISAPTQSFLQKWLRENHDININIFTVSSYDSKKQYQFSIHRTYVMESGRFNSYEEALELALQKSLNLI